VSGDKLWRRKIATGEESFRGDEGNLASPSPTTDGRYVVAVMGEGTMACYTVDGQSVWSLSLAERLTGPLNIQFGYASSPVLHEGRVFVQWLHGDGDAATHEARVAAFDIATGETVWAVERLTGAKLECEHSYASPLVAGEGDAAVLVTHGADATVAYDPENGDEAWRLLGMNSPGSYHPTLRFVASPAAGEGILVAPTAKRESVAAVRLGAHGDLTGGAAQLWRLDRGTPDVLAHVAELIPDEWLAPAATGSPERCAEKIMGLLELGCDGVILHGASPQELEPIVAAWRKIRPAGRFDDLSANPAGRTATAGA